MLILSLFHSFIDGNRCLIGCCYVLYFIRFILLFFFLLPSKIQNKKGKVNVSHENNIRHLLPGQQLNYQKASKSMEVTDIDTYQYISWKDGILAFRDDPLETIFDRLEQVYQVRFILKDPSISQFTYRATFKGETLDEILDYMGMSIPITFRTTETKQEGNDSVSVRTIEVYKN